MEAEYLDNYEKKLGEELTQYCTEKGMLKGQLMESPDLADYWKAVEGDYLADAVPQVADYPLVSVAWAAYLGMGVAHYWDTDWESRATMPYKQYYGSDGFDNMDDHIVQDILGLPLEGAEAQGIIRLIQRLAQQAVAKIRHEQIEPQSPLAYYVFQRTCKTMFAIGAALQLNRMGYSLQPL